MSGSKRTPTSVRKPIKHKDKDKPKRPLSAYNYFFKEERQKITKAVFCEDESLRKKIDPDLTVDQIKKLKKSNDNVSFEEMGKLIGSRWRVITETPDRVYYYASLAKADAERYGKEKEVYYQRKEQMRYNAESAHDTTHTPWHQMHYHMPYQHPGMSTPQSGMHFSHMGYNNGYQTGTNTAYGHGQTPITGTYNPYYRSDAPYASDRHYFNNRLDQNNSGINFQHRSENYNSYRHPIPMSYSQATPREHMSYPHEQYFNNQSPHYQPHFAQNSGIGSDPYYSYNRVYQHT